LNYIFKLMNQNEAEVISNWHYPDRYSFYDAKNDAEDLAELLDPKRRGYHYYSVLVENELVGFFEFHYDMDDRSTVVGLGLAPHLTGKGLGFDFVEKGLTFGLKTFPGTLSFKLSVASFNKRAITVYERSGFQTIGESMVETNGGIYKFVHMQKETAA
jgi:[ribosomal protein S18]-alanine N-acetyltransferase